MTSAQVALAKPVGDQRMTVLSPATAAARLEALDGLRGMAALVVLVWHFFLAFIPLRVGSFPGFDPSAGLIGTPIFGLINGEAAVTFFFVLSGFVLPARFFARGDPELLLRGAAKRWFRLVALVLIAVLVSWALRRFGLFANSAAAEITDSTWLQSFAEAHPERHQYGLGAALAQGLIWVFLRGDSFFDPSLWTMHFEFTGSLVSLGFAALLLRANWKSIVWLTGIGIALAQISSPFMIAFLAGTALSALWAQRPITLSGRTATALALSALLLFAFKEPRGVFAILGDLDQDKINSAQIWFHTAASVLAICASLGHSGLRRWLSSAPLRFLGTISFAVYLVHLLVFFSFTSWLYLRLDGVMPKFIEDWLAFTASTAVILLVSTVLARLDMIWLGLVDRRLMRLIIP